MGDRSRDDELRSDAALIAALKEDDFQGKGWDRFEVVLARQGHNFVESWMALLRLDPSPWRGGRLTEEAVSALIDIAARAINYLRLEVLRPGRWSPDEGVVLRVSFAAQCLIEFSGIQDDRWPREYAHPHPYIARLIPDGHQILRSLKDLITEEPIRAREQLSQLHEYTAHELDELLDRTRETIEILEG
jgi:hypothetical protein